jgi:hypothetical protein
MENEGKYYTPTIEEFHVGFEYEVKKEESWFRCFYSQGSLVDIYYKYNDDLDSIDFEADTIRIKYLDQEDIESLGFEVTLIYGDNIEANTKNIKLLYNIAYKIMDIEVKLSSNTTKSVFYGIIKNKSELIKVLKQVNINE